MLGEAKSARESQSHSKASCGNSSQHGDYTGDSNDCVLGDPCGLFEEAFRTQSPPPTDATLRREGGRARGRGHRRAPASGARHSAQRRQQGGGRGSRSALASHSQLRLQTCSSPPPPPPPPPPHPGPPAGLSVSSLPPYWPARVHFRALGIWYRSGPGAREQVAAAGQLGRQPAAPGPVSRRLCRQSLPGGPLCPPGPRALPAGLGAGSGAAAAPAARRAELGADSRREAGGEGPSGARANMAEVSIDQSKLPGVKEAIEHLCINPPIFYQG
ncbi:hypothetical protein J1605_015908 [Eschrichtius robustus]|uniref:Uncharacterized protein n=1 Tax=Eschrichtius robustus TaxID=9764 RepID=A0AB34G986_ESCRO|nr:hypothetical protein J1605_015908 [Eschrichtius robustus]